MFVLSVGQKQLGAPDEIEGDIARMLFYMDLRYEAQDQSGVGDLQWVNRDQLPHNNQLGSLSVLLQWHCSDPVSADELRRNDIINTLQGNRNPVVDYPGWVVPIYGHEC